MSEVKIVDGVKITTDEDGSQHFEIVEKRIKKRSDNRSFLKRLCDWIFNQEETIIPYVKSRDFSDPFDQRKEDPFDDRSGSESGTEIGLKVTF